MGITLKEAREKKGLTQVEAAKQMEIYVEMLNTWERGHYTPSYKYLKRLSDFYDIPIDDFIFSCNKG